MTERIVLSDHQRRYLEAGALETRLNNFIAQKQLPAIYLTHAAREKIVSESVAAHCALPALFDRAVFLNYASLLRAGVIDASVAFVTVDFAAADKRLGFHLHDKSTQA